MATIRVKEGFEVYPEGLYFLKVKKIDVQEVRQGDRAGEQFLTWEEHIIDAHDENYISETFKHTTPLEISPRSKYFRLLEVLGVRVPEDGQEVEYDTDDFLDREFVASVGLTKIMQGRNAGKEKNEFKQLWTPEEFQAFQEKSSKLTNKLKPSSPPVKESTTASITPHLSHKNTEKVTPPVSQRKNIINSSNLGDFPE